MCMGVANIDSGQGWHGSGGPTFAFLAWQEGGFVYVGGAGKEKVSSSLNHGLFQRIKCSAC